MTSRSISLSAIFGWIPGSFRLVGRALPSFAGASALTILAGFALTIPLWLILGLNPMDPAMAGASAAGAIGKFLGAYAVMLLLYLLVFPPIMLGWARLCRRVDEGARVSAFEIFGPYRESSTWLRAVGLTLAFLLAIVLVFALFAAAFWGTVMQFAQAMAAQKLGGTPTLPGGLGALVLGYFVLLAVVILVQWTQMVAANEVALRPTGVLQAMWLAFAGLLRNAGKLLVFGFCLFVALILVLVVLGVVIGVFGAALALLGPKASMLGILLIEMPFMLVAYPVFFAAAYCMWKSVLGDEPTDLPAADEAFVAA